MFPKKFKNLIDDFAHLPSIGPKMAERIVLFLFRQEKEKLLNFSNDIKEFALGISFCPRCFFISENDLCHFCLDQKRNSNVICVVEDPLDVIAIEKTKQFNGRYHVLGGLLSVVREEEIGKLRIKELIERVKNEKVKEVIIATNPTTEGEATSFYLARNLRSFKIRITRLARGLASGSDIEYTDQITLASAIEGRKEI